MRLSAAVVLLVGASAMAQMAFQAASPSYNGQNVSAISLIANPHRDLQTLYPLVTQKAGEPYSQEKIEADAKTLQQAGHFPEVKAAVVPEVGGLRVLFLLEPAYYLGIVEFPEATKLFSYTRLLQVANLSDEDPYDPSRIPDALSALRDFFHRNGYFQAEVHGEPAIDDAHELVNVTFAIRVGKRAKISTVNINGAEDGERLRLLHAVHSLRARLSRGLLKAGKPYSRERLSAATTLIKKALTGQ